MPLGKGELVKGRSDAEKLAADAEAARKALADELAKVKAGLADQQKTVDVAVGERERLNGVVKKLSNDLVDVKLLAEADVEIKDGYINHLAYLLESQLGLLPAKVANEIKEMPATFGIVFTPQKYSKLQAEEIQASEEGENNVEYYFCV